MEDVYDLHQHTHCVVFHIENSEVNIASFSTSERNSQNYESKLRKSCITYDKQTSKVLSWGDESFTGTPDLVKIDRFKERLYIIFKRGKDNWNQDDLFFIKAISDFMRLSIEKLMKEKNKIINEIKNLDMLHYIFIVPSEWEEEIREVVIKHIFVEAGLISRDDHEDRLLYCSNVESIFYYLTGPTKFLFTSGMEENTILARIDEIQDRQVTVDLDLLSTGSSLFTSSKVLLLPKVKISNSFVLTMDDIKSGIREHLKNEPLFYNQERTIELITEVLSSKNFYSMTQHIGDHLMGHLMGPFNTEASLRELSIRQKELIKSIRAYDICVKIIKNTFDISYSMLYDNVKKYNFVICVDNYASKINRSNQILQWSKLVLEYYRISISSKSNVNNMYRSENITYGNIISGVCRYAFSVIRNSDIYSKPRILSTENVGPCSTMFLKSKPDAIMTIDISLESIQLSFLFLSKDGLIKKIWDHNYFVNYTRSHSLESILSFLDFTTIKIKSSFLVFVEKYLENDFDSHSENDEASWNKNIVEEMKSILNKEGDIKDLLASIEQQELTQEPVQGYMAYMKSFISYKNSEPKYVSIQTQRKKDFNKFVEIYLLYIKNVILNKLSNIVGSDSTINIGYAVTIENVALRKLFGTEENLRSMIYSSGLLRKDNSSRKLRIILKGEGLLPIIKQYFRRTFPIKSFFIVAQLFKSHIQLTLNQVVTKPNSDEEDQETIIIRDETIHIPNIYESLSLNMWNNIVEDNSLIQLCDAHSKCNDHEQLEIFSLENRAEFTTHFKKYIFKNILRNNCIPKNADKITMHLSKTCNCKVYLTIHDVVNISFLPVLQGMISLVSTSLINNQLFGKYSNIQYIFYLINFNYNPQFQQILIKILNDETENFIYEEKIDVCHYVIPKLASRLTQPVLHQQPFSYKAFQMGTLHHIYSQNYGYNFIKIDEESQIIYRSKISNTDAPIDYAAVYRLFKKGDTIKNFQTSRIFYLNSQNDVRIRAPIINYTKLNDIEGLKFVRTADFKSSEIISGPSLGEKYINPGEDLPFIISISYDGYSSSLSLVLRMVGEKTEEKHLVKLAEPMTLFRF